MRKGQLSFERVNGWGGKRRGAGRPNKSGTPNHLKRPKVDFRKPLHVTLKLRKGVASLRTPKFFKEFQQAMTRAQQFGLHVNHFSILADHIHLIVEAANNRSLSAGMKSLVGRLGKRITRGGSVFRGRFHLHVLKTPTEMKNALRYVLLNYANHRKWIAHMDEFSSAAYFTSWRELMGKRFEPLLMLELTCVRDYLPDFLEPPRSWLARTGWRRASG